MYDPHIFLFVKKRQKSHALQAQTFLSHDTFSFVNDKKTHRIEFPSSTFSTNPNIFAFYTKPNATREFCFSFQEVLLLLYLKRPYILL
jgi:hypothetical protein